VSVYDLYQSYLNAQKTPAPAASNILDPSYLLYLQQQQNQGAGGEGLYDPTNTIGTGENLGINSLSDAFSAIQGQMTPGSVIGGLLGGIPGALIGRGIGSLVSNIQNPYTNMFGQLNKETQSAITREEVRDLQSRIDRGDFGGKAGGGGGFSGHGGYGSSAERGGALHG